MHGQLNGTVQGNGAAGTACVGVAIPYHIIHIIGRPDACACRPTVLCVCVHVHLHRLQGIQHVHGDILQCAHVQPAPGSLHLHAGAPHCAACTCTINTGHIALHRTQPISTQGLHSSIYSRNSSNRTYFNAVHISYLTHYSSLPLKSRTSLQAPKGGKQLRKRQRLDRREGMEGPHTPDAASATPAASPATPATSQPCTGADGTQHQRHGQQQGMADMRGPELQGQQCFGDEGEEEERM
eukprot:scaffold73415_cov17-Tisochrysis_lutea.AAC.1